MGKAGSEVLSLLYGKSFQGMETKGDNAKVLSPEIYGNISFNRYFLLNKKNRLKKSICFFMVRDEGLHIHLQCLPFFGSSFSFLEPHAVSYATGIFSLCMCPFGFKSHLVLTSNKKRTIDVIVLFSLWCAMRD